MSSSRLAISACLSLLTGCRLGDPATWIAKHGTALVGTEVQVEAEISSYQKHAVEIPLNECYGPCVYFDGVTLKIISPPALADRELYFFTPEKSSIWKRHEGRVEFLIASPDLLSALKGAQRKRGANHPLNRGIPLDSALTNVKFLRTR